MLCPVCRHDNFEGEDNCENCGADLRTSDIPQPAVDFRGRLLGQHLDALRALPPQTLDVSADAAQAIRLMHESAIDCVLVTDGCCGCNEGGKQRAIPARARDGYEKKRKAVCRKTMCPALMSEDPTCLAPHAVCKAGTCGLGS